MRKARHHRFHHSLRNFRGGAGGSVDHGVLQMSGFKDCLQFQGSPQVPPAAGRISDVALLNPLPADCFLSCQPDDEQLPMFQGLHVLCDGGLLLDDAGKNQRGYAGSMVVRCHGFEVGEFEGVVEGVSFHRRPGLPDTVQIDDRMRHLSHPEEITQRVGGGCLARSHGSVQKDGNACKSHSSSVVFPPKSRAAAPVPHSYRWSGAVAVLIA